jgi:hypothetical protein
MPLSESRMSRFERPDITDILAQKARRGRERALLGLRRSSQFSISSRRRLRRSFRPDSRHARALRGICLLCEDIEDVDGRDKPGHDADVV